MHTGYAGVDISARWFDACLMIDGKRFSKRFANNLNGFAEFTEWLKGHLCQDYVAAFEPTGRYGEAFADYVCESGVELFQVDLRKFRQYAGSLLPDCKSDGTDAFALAMFAKERSQSCRRYVVPSAFARQSRDFQMRLRSLERRSVALQNQLKCGIYSELVHDSLRRELETVTSEYKQVFSHLRQLIEQDPISLNDKTLLESIPGIGEKTAIMLLSMIEFRKFHSSRALAKFLGLTQRKRESGSSVRGKPMITKAGNKHVRSALTLPAMSAMQYNQALEGFCERLTANGKPGAVVRTAVARKLITVAWSVIHHNRPFDPNFAA